MRNVRWASALILGSIISSSMTPANAADVPLRRILLTTGGVGYFEHETTVDGNGSLSLGVRLDQVSDVLKSIVVFDNRGSLGRVSLAGREPLAEMFRDLPFTVDDLSSPDRLLRALRGSMIRMTINASIMEGRIISVVDEMTSLPDGRGTIVRHRLSLLATNGLRQAIVEDASAIEFVDPTLRAQVEQALLAIAENSEHERRSLEIRVEGSGERTVNVGYVVAVPLWKATYRLVLPNVGRRKAQMEGYALLENMSGQDWVGVDLTVASGNPVTFRQALYDSYFVTRPEVPVEVFGRILPPIDTGAVAPKARSAGSFGLRSAVQPFAAESLSDGTSSNAPSDPTEAVEGATSVTFHFPQPVDLGRGEVMLAPIVQREMQAERVSVFRRDVDKTNPVASVRLLNDSETSLPPGAVTMYEMQGSPDQLEFVGDARLGALPAGQERLLGYAADLDMRVDVEDKSAQMITGATIDRGVLLVRRAEQRMTMYRIVGATGEERTLIIEHPRIAGFSLLPPSLGTIVGDIPTHHRIQLNVPAGQTVEVKTTLERPIEERVSILNAATTDLSVFIAAAEIPAGVRDALKQVAILQRTLVDRQQGLAALEADRETVVADQARLRANLAVVPAESDLRTRYLTALGETEDRIMALDQGLEVAREAVKVARDELEAFIGSLSR